MSVPFAIFGINSSGLNTAVKLVVLFLVVIWAGARLLQLRRRAPAA